MVVLVVVVVGVAVVVVVVVVVVGASVVVVVVVVVVGASVVVVVVVVVVGASVVVEVVVDVVSRHPIQSKLSVQFVMSVHGFIVIPPSVVGTISLQTRSVDPFASETFTGEPEPHG